MQVEFITEEVPLQDLWDQAQNRTSDEGGIDLPVMTYKGMRFADKVFRNEGYTIRITLSDGTTLEGLKGHRLMNEEYEWVFLDEIEEGDMILDQNELPVVVAKVEATGLVREVFDLQVPGEHHYIANGMISHNSTLANQLAVNISSMGYPVDILPLEMTELEMSARIMATVTRFDSMKILLQRMTRAEKALVEQRMLKWRKMLHRKQSYYAIHKPKEDITMEEALSIMTAPVKIIDYMGLLANTDGDDQWRKLGAATRYAKIYAEATNSLVIVLAQLDQHGVIRYSRAMAEHMNNLWAFVANKDTREAGIINIEQQKARNQRMFSFSLKIDSDMMRVYDLPNNGVDWTPPKQGQQDDNLPNLADTV